MIFEPGCIVFTVSDQQDCAVRFQAGNYCETQLGPAFSLKCEKIDWDGENFGLSSSRYLLYSFNGTTSITKLHAYPMEYHPFEDKKKNQLIQRGREFERLHGYHYKAYQGIAIGQGCWGPVKYNVRRASVPVGFANVSAND